MVTTARERRQTFSRSRWIIKLGLDVVLRVVRDGGEGDDDGDGGDSARVATMVNGV